MRKLTIAMFNDKKGMAAMTIMIMILGILIVLITSYGLITANMARSTNNIIKSAQAFYVSEAGVEDGIFRYVKSGGALSTTDPTYTVTLFSGGSKTDVAIGGATSATLTSTSDAGSRKRKIQVTMNANDIYTYAALVGDGGLWMSDNTDIKCVSGTGCQGETEAGDAGTVYVNGNLWANGANGGGKYGLSGRDARIVGHAYVTGKVDIRPSEKKEPAATSTPEWVCLGAATVSADCPLIAGAIAQKVRIHEGGYTTKRAALRVAYTVAPGRSATDLPVTKFYPVKYASGSWRYSQRIVLDKDIAVSDTDNGQRVFANFPIDSNADGIAEPLGQNNPDWVYFNFPLGGLTSVNDGDYIYLVLQTETAASDNAYWKVYFDRSAAPAYIHTGGYGKYIAPGASSQFCPTSGGSDICNLSSSALSNDAFSTEINDDRGQPRADFHFRVYSQDAAETNYAHSLQVTGELHADEAIGATVVGEGSSSDNKKIAFVGRRFASAFWKDRQANQMLWGHSFVQQLDNCDITGSSGTETADNNIETRRGSRVFCDSQVRNISGVTTYGSNRRYSSGASYPVLTNPPYSSGFYCNLYKNADSVTHGGDQTACSVTGDTGQDKTPYQFNELASAGGRGCYFSCGSNGSSCDNSDEGFNYKSYYIYPVLDQATYGRYPYNFCKYASNTIDSAQVSEQEFKDNVLAPGPLNITDPEIQNRYLPKGPTTKSPFPISDNKINAWVGGSGGITWGTCIVGSHTISANTSWSSPTCVEGDLIITNSSRLLLNRDAHVHVKGNLRLIGGGSKIEMNNSSNPTLGWDSNTVGLVIVDKVVDTEPGTQFLGGNKAEDEYMLVISRSNNMGERDPIDPLTGLPPAVSESNLAAIYSFSQQDSGATVSFYAPNGSVVLERDGSNPNAMQVTARKLIMRRYTQLNYDYGILDEIFPGGPASAFGIGDYDEVAP